MDRNGNGVVDRRQALECMVWGGTGLVWTLSGGIPAAKIIGEAQAAPIGFSFVQISDSHIGFDKLANPNVLGTLEEAIAKVGALRTKPAFMIHTGDITHLSKPQQFDDAEQRIARAKRAETVHMDRHRQNPSRQAPPSQKSSRQSRMQMNESEQRRNHIYSDDEDIEALEKTVKIQVIGLSALPLPPEKAQLDL